MSTISAALCKPRAFDRAGSSCAIAIHFFLLIMIKCCNCNLFMILKNANSDACGSSKCLYRENAIASVINRSAISRVHALMREKICRIYATAVAFTTCVPPVMSMTDDFWTKSAFRPLAHAPRRLSSIFI